MTEIIQHIVFSDWLLSLNNIHLCFLHVFSWLDNSFLFSIIITNIIIIIIIITNIIILLILLLILLLIFHCLDVLWFIYPFTY